MRLIASITIIFIALSIYFSPYIIKIENINCISNYGQCNQDIELSLKEANNQTLRNAKKHINQILSNQSSVTNHDIRFQFPAELNVYLIEQKPEFAIKIGESANYLLVSTQGSILGFSNETPLPKTTSESELSDQEIKHVAKLGRRMFLIYGIKESQIRENAFVTSINDKYSVYFPLSGDIDVLIGSLELILSQLNRANGNLKIGQDETVSPNTIDLRYINPVLR